MGHYLRDQKICNIEIDLDGIACICDIVSERVDAWNNSARSAQLPQQEISISYLIRFDGKGFIIFKVDELKKYYEQARKIERIVIQASNGNPNVQNLASIELSLDVNNDEISRLAVSSNIKDWMESTFSCLNEALQKYTTKNGFVRKWWTPFFIQMLGLFIGFFLSIWGASSVYTYTSLESPFAVALIFFILLFSNVWTFVYPRVLSFVFYIFPNVAFAKRRMNSVHWIYQTLIGSTVFAIVAVCFSKLWNVTLKYFGNFIE